MKIMDKLFVCVWSSLPNILRFNVDIVNNVGASICCQKLFVYFPVTLHLFVSRPPRIHQISVCSSPAMVPWLLLHVSIYICVCEYMSGSGIFACACVCLCMCCFRSRLHESEEYIITITNLSSYYFLKM